MARLAPTHREVILHRVVEEPADRSLRFDNAIQRLERSNLAPTTAVPAASPSSTSPAAVAGMRALSAARIR